MTDAALVELAPVVGLKPRCKLLGWDTVDNMMPVPRYDRAMPSARIRAIFADR